MSVELEFGKWSDTHRLVDDAGHDVAVQLTQPQGSAKERSRPCFVADLPPLGYRLYRVTSAAAPEPQVTGLSLIATDTMLENEYLRLEIDPMSGCIRSLYDKRAKVEVFERQAARAIVLQDESDTWSHNTFRYDCPAGEFRPRRVRLVEHGPVRAVIRVESEYGASLLVQDFTLYRQLDQVDVQVTVDWREQFRLLKLRFPVNLTNVQATYEIPYGQIERPANGDEEPGQSWVDLSGLARETRERYGLAVLNDGKYSLDVNLSDIGLTVLRSPIYAHHLPIVPDPNGLYSFIDQGIQHFSYSLVPHGGSWEDAGIVRRAAELNARPITLLETFHAGGSLPPRNSYVGVDRENIVVSTIKQAEDGQDVIVRAYETAQVSTDVTISLPHLDRTITARFGPCEIKTFRVPIDPDQPITETNLLGDPV
jgi:alpha-mannosidase